ncbi:MAG: hypothetical protein M1825_005696 [Sarcosagium campestre]|nr:MAG: hypothetical protein M1825_005696 [Sarcosagium campestre]
MASASTKKFGLLQDLILIAAANVSVYYLIKYTLSSLDPEKKHKEEEARTKSAAVLRRLEGVGNGSDRTSEDGTRIRPRKEDLTLNQYEQAIAMDLVAPEDIPVSFEDIGGLDYIIEELKESVLYPLTLPHLYSQSSSLLSAPSGVLLYGPPGCGKTMLAKALAHESGACFINLHISTLTEKWYGDSNKMVSAVFSLAKKLQPTIVFIDEIDAVLGTRRSGEHEASGMVKAEFMTHWDGLTSSSASGRPQRILMLGATNRIQDIDEAILRRMPKKFPVSLPAARERKRILSLVLSDTKLDQDNFDIDKLVQIMAGLSGSDIKEACRDAAMLPVREFIKQGQSRGESMNNLRLDEVRGLRTEDFLRSSASIYALKQQAGGKAKSKVSDVDTETESSSTDSRSGELEEVVD